MISKSTTTADFVVIGAGILGLSIASKLYDQYPNAKIIVIEKENAVGLHASGRNSGVLHSGIYYPPESLKANLCTRGSRMMLQYCKEHALPFSQLGKVIIPTSTSDADTLKLLYERGMANGVQVDFINESQLRELEPATHSVTGNALFVAETTVVDPLAIVQHLYEDLRAKGVVFHLNACCRKINIRARKIELGTMELSYRHLVNTAGLYADKIAEICGIKNKYTMLPFKGLYYELSKQSTIKVNRLIYPVPDMNVPFLGVHFTKTVYGKIYAGPTAIPALGREQYSGLKGMKLGEAANALYHLFRQYKLDQQGFRTYAHNEIARFLKPKFVSAAKLLIPATTMQDLALSKKVGIRAQLLDISNRKLVMDFLTEQTNNETHILNAVSPAFTSAFSFSDYVVGLIDAKLEMPTGSIIKNDCTSVPIGQE